MAFTLKRDSRLAKWAFWFETGTMHESDWDSGKGEYITTYRGKVPKQTSLCNLFWRVFLFAPLCVAVPVGAVGALLFDIVLLTIHEPKTVIIIASGLALIIFWAWICTLAKERNLRAAFKETLLYQGAKAVKGKFCPIIKFD